MNYQEYAEKIEAIVPLMRSLGAAAESRAILQKAAAGSENWPGWPAPASVRLAWALTDALQACRDEIGGLSAPEPLERAE
jgi:hypothetical protein